MGQEGKKTKNEGGEEEGKIAKTQAACLTLHPQNKPRRPCLQQLLRSFSQQQRPPGVGTCRARMTFVRLRLTKNCLVRILFTCRSSFSLPLFFLLSFPSTLLRRNSTNLHNHQSHCLRIRQRRPKGFAFPTIRCLFSCLPPRLFQPPQNQQTQRPSRRHSISLSRTRNWLHLTRILSTSDRNQKRSNMG